MPKAIAYPFLPRSITNLRPGQFWAVPLSSGRFACGRVLYVPAPDDPLYRNTRVFLAGLMDWSAEVPPTADAIAGCAVVEQGMMHVVGLDDTGSEILGHRDLTLDGITGLRAVSHRAGGTVWLYEGGLRLRPATHTERQTLPVLGTWGRVYVQRLADRHFVRGIST